MSVNRARVLSRSGVSFEKQSFLLIIDLVEQNIFQIFSISKKRLGRSIDCSRNCSRNTSDIERNSYLSSSYSLQFSNILGQTIPNNSSASTIAKHRSNRPHHREAAVCVLLSHLCLHRQTQRLWAAIKGRNSGSGNSGCEIGTALAS